MNEQLQNELEEQARLLGMSAERECDLRGKIERLERERDDLKDQLTAAMMSIRLQQRREQQTNEQP
jgi:peptidoglycan hydrolase CwlO-like protein